MEQISGKIKTGVKAITITAQKGETVHNILRDNGIYLDAPCGGKGTCGKCKAKITGNVSKLSDKERTFLAQTEIENHIRLACLCKVHGDFTVEAEQPFYEDFKAGLKLTAHKNGIGAAADIGTTTVTVYFYDLETGERLYSVSELNNQKAFGADVISRINYCIHNKEGNKKLQKVIIEQINSMAEEFCKLADISKESVTEYVITGNTVMELLAAGYDVTSLGALPFTPASLMGETKYVKDISFTVNEKTKIYFMPAVSGFLGGDIIASMLACDFDTQKSTSLLIDIGTNGEIALRHNGIIYCCSAAAGSAFEGAQIKNGTGSVKGAIKKVFTEKDRVVIETIGNGEPVGICGSGLIDAISVMLQKNVIDKTGKIVKENKDFFALTKDICITQKDIREVQLAKSAIASGIAVLLSTAGISSKDIEKVFLAGSFGSAINPESAGKIGLLPMSLSKKAKILGNAAGLGAVKCLLNEENKIRAEKIAINIKTVILASNPVFEKEFIDNLQF